MDLSMLNWRLRRKKRELSGYSRLRSIPNRQLPRDLVDQECSVACTAGRDAIQRMLLEPPRRPLDDAPLFTTLLSMNKRGVVTLTLPDSGGQCVLVFTAPVRAADYVDVLLPRGPSVQYFVSSPDGLFSLLSNSKATGIEFVTLDRCPRCAVIMSTDTSSIHTASDLITLWSIVKSTQVSRLELYLDYALKFARAGLFEIAREVAIETVGHVSMEDPRPHLLLGQVAVALSDDTLFREAKTFLRLLKFDAWERKLDQDALSGALDFECPTFFSNLVHE
jgi:hypothetical protein